MRHRCRPDRGPDETKAVYTVYQTGRHLGIFVSGKVATKEHAEFTSCMDLIEMLPPGLFEAVITEVDEETGESGTGHTANICSGWNPACRTRSHPHAGHQQRRRSKLL